MRLSWSFDSRKLEVEGKETVLGRRFEVLEVRDEREREIEKSGGDEERSLRKAGRHLRSTAPEKSCIEVTNSPLY